VGYFRHVARNPPASGPKRRAASVRYASIRWHECVLIAARGGCTLTTGPGGIWATFGARTGRFSLLANERKKHRGTSVEFYAFLSSTNRLFCQKPPAGLGCEGLVTDRFLFLLFARCKPHGPLLRYSPGSLDACIAPHRDRSGLAGESRFQRLVSDPRKSVIAEVSERAEVSGGTRRPSTVIRQDPLVSFATGIPSRVPRCLGGQRGEASFPGFLPRALRTTALRWDRAGGIVAGGRRHHTPASWDSRISGGQRLNSFELLEPNRWAAGWGTVFRAVDERLGRDRRGKQSRAFAAGDPRPCNERFRNEASKVREKLDQPTDRLACSRAATMGRVLHRFFEYIDAVNIRRHRFTERTACRSDECGFFLNKKKLVSSRRGDRPRRRSRDRPPRISPSNRGG